MRLGCCLCPMRPEDFNLYANSQFIAKFLKYEMNKDFAAKMGASNRLQTRIL